LFHDLISGLHTLGYSWEEVHYADNVNGLWQGIEQIENSLDRGIPVLIDTSTGIGHTFVVAGYSQSEQSLYVVDASLPAPGVRTVTFGELENIWNSSSVGFDKRAAAFPERRHNKN
jgi:peptidase C39-like protein